MSFDPFENRLCRDVRNSIGDAFIRAIHSQSMVPFEEAEKTWTLNTPQSHITDYIRNRKTHLMMILKGEPINGNHRQTEDPTPVFLWNHGLFFEFHEWIEHLWKKESGEMKKSLQALIIAAVVYEHKTYQRHGPAKKLADKAIRIIKKQKRQFPDWVNPDRLADGLARLDVPSPELNRPAPPNKGNLK